MKGDGARLMRGRRWVESWLLPAVAGLTMSSCGSEPPASASAERVDSAGIEIVTNRGAAWEAEPAWRLLPTPVLSIGTIEGGDEEQLFRVVGAARLGDGRVVVANAGSSELRFYQEDGSYLSSVGGSGDGPGEFREMSSLHVGAVDSLWVYDRRSRRVSIFSDAGDFARSLNVPLLGSSDFPSFLGVFDDNSALLGTDHIYSAERDVSGINRPTQTLYRMKSAGGLVDTIGHFPGTESYVETNGSSLNIMSFKFARSSVVTAAGNGFHFSSADESEIESYSLDGRPQRLIRWVRAARPVTPADVERWKRERMAGMPEGLRQMTQAMVDHLPFPETMPSLSEVRVDTEGNIWAQDYQAWDTDAPRWFVFGRDGQLLGDLSMPVGFRVYQIGSDYVLGRRIDELEIEHVDVYSLEKSAG